MELLKKTMNKKQAERFVKKANGGKSISVRFVWASQLDKWQRDYLGFAHIPEGYIVINRNMWKRTRNMDKKGTLLHELGHINDTKWRIVCPTEASA